MTDNDHHGRLARELEATGSYRVLRRVDLADLDTQVEFELDYRTGLVIDVETTGLDPTRDKVIELAARHFWATRDGVIVAVGPSRSWLEDPGTPLSPEIVALTGLTDADLAGRRIEDDEVITMMVRADFIVAHNARFDRPFIERRFPTCRELAWCCSLNDTDWGSHGFDGRSLGWLLAQCGAFHDGHRAAADVDATLALLRHRLPTDRTVLAHILERAEQPSWHVRAVGAHFDVKDRLKARGYGWDGTAKIWSREVPDEALKAEEAWLSTHIYQPEHCPRALGPAIAEVNWLTRYSH